MGSAMASNLHGHLSQTRPSPAATATIQAAGLSSLLDGTRPLHVWNRDGSKCAPMVAQGAVACGSLKELAEKCQVSCCTEHCHQSVDLDLTTGWTNVSTHSYDCLNILSSTCL